MARYATTAGRPDTIRDCKLPRIQRVQGIWEDDGFQNYEDYDDAYDEEWYEWGYGGDS